MPRVYSPVEFAVALEKFGKETQRELVNAIRRGMTLARSLAVKEVQKRGVGRALFGKKGSGARLLIKFSKIRSTSRGTVTAGLELKGLVAMIEQGGHTKPHVILPKNASVLALKLPTGPAFARIVQHPGSRIPAQPFAQDAMSAALPRITTEIDKGMQKLADKVIG